MKPLTTTIILSFIVLASSCISPMDRIEQAEQVTIKWISDHPKPISVIGYATAMNGAKRYTLIDSNGKIFVTDYTMMYLPKVLTK